MPEPMRADDDDADSIMMEYLDSLSPEAQAYIHEFGFDAEHFRDWVIVRRMRMTPRSGWLGRRLKNKRNIER